MKDLNAALAPIHKHCDRWKLFQPDEQEEPEIEPNEDSDFDMALCHLIDMIDSALLRRVDPEEMLKEIRQYCINERPTESD